MNAPAKPPAPQTLVVVVEDNIPAKDLLCDWLKLSYRVEAYLDGESAAAACKGSDDMAIFLLDYNLPGINGIDLKHKLEKLYPTSKFVLVSGLFDQQLTNRAQSAGFHLLLPKPFSMAALSSKMQQLLGVAPDPTIADVAKAPRKH